MTMRCASRSAGKAAGQRCRGKVVLQHRSARSETSFTKSDPQSTRPNRGHCGHVTFATKTTVIPSPSYAIPISLAGIATLAWVADVKALAGIAGVLGVFLAIQASRVKFIFDDEALVGFYSMRSRVKGQIAVFSTFKNFFSRLSTIAGSSHR